MNGFQLDGYGNVMNIFRKMPMDGYSKPIIAAFKTAAEPIKKAMINNLPANLKALKKVIKIKPGKGKSLRLAVGPFGGQAMYRNSRGVTWDPYMLIYWANYGTLVNRDQGHSFQYPIKKISINRRGGIKPGGFVEKAVNESLPKAEKIFEKTYEEEHIKFLERMANR
jgi:hypothetical protein